MSPLSYSVKLQSEVTKDCASNGSLTGETFEQRTANTSDYARLDISKSGFWT